LLMISVMNTSPHKSTLASMQNIGSLHCASHTLPSRVSIDVAKCMAVKKKRCLTALCIGWLLSKRRGAPIEQQIAINKDNSLGSHGLSIDLSANDVSRMPL